MKKLLVLLFLILTFISIKCEIDNGQTPTLDPGWDKGPNDGYTPRDAKY